MSARQPSKEGGETAIKVMHRNTLRTRTARTAGKCGLLIGLFGVLGCGQQTYPDYLVAVVAEPNAVPLASPRGSLALVSRVDGRLLWRQSLRAPTGRGQLLEILPVGPSTILLAYDAGPTIALTQLDTRTRREVPLPISPPRYLPLGVVKPNVVYAQLVPASALESRFAASPFSSGEDGILDLRSGGFVAQPMERVEDRRIRFENVTISIDDPTEPFRYELSVREGGLPAGQIPRTGYFGDVSAQGSVVAAYYSDRREFEYSLILYDLRSKQLRELLKPADLRRLLGE